MVSPPFVHPYSTFIEVEKGWRYLGGMVENGWRSLAVYSLFVGSFME
jgi:hypothetical protein